MLSLLRKILVWTGGGLLALVVALHLWFSWLLGSPPPQPTGVQPDGAYYFAYGSNMSPQYLARIRGVELQWSAPASAADFTVEFGLPGIPWLEPAFANLRPQPGNTAVGVVHRLSEQGLIAITNSEGSSYRWREIPVSTPDGQVLTAWTLVSVPEQPATAPPSRRYLKIMHDAATRYDFPREELEKLNPDQGAYIPLASEALGTLIQTGAWVSARL